MEKAYVKVYLLIKACFTDFQNTRGWFKAQINGH